MADEKLTCRKCSECDGRHHWLEHCEPDDGGDDGVPAGFVGYVCKHCDATREMTEDDL